MIMVLFSSMDIKDEEAAKASESTEKSYAFPTTKVFSLSEIFNFWKLFA